MVKFHKNNNRILSLYSPDDALIVRDTYGEIVV